MRAKRILLILVGLVAVGAVVYAVVPSGEDAAQRMDRVDAVEAKDTAPLEDQAGLAEAPLSAENTTVGFACSKTLAGKTVTVRGGWSNKFGSTIEGKALVDPEAGRVVSVEFSIDLASLWSEHTILTDALLTKGFFNVEEYPMATFVSTSIEAGAPEGSIQEDATHRVEGNLSLNGIRRSITFPAKIELSGSNLKVHTEFSLPRRDFEVLFVDTVGFGLLTDENISDLVAVTATVDAEVVSDSLAAQKVAQVEERMTRLEGVLTRLEERLAALEEAVARGPQVAPAPDVPEPADNGEPEPVAAGEPALAPAVDLPASYTETIPATQEKFEMVLVPGDTASGIGPLYVGKNEVTWDEFLPWVDGRDLEDSDQMGELRAMQLRPSPPYGMIDRGFGMYQRPALGMSRLSAELYCKWLSEQTGKTYRLPTEKEWEHFYKAGGGSLEGPPTAEEADRIAVYADNSFDEEIETWATRKIETTEPNSLGIHDLAGNVCEWVTDTGDERVARGGHYDGPLEELGVGRHVETPDWNRDYPNEPKSVWWFVNAPWVGFRVVAEP